MNIWLHITCVQKAVSSVSLLGVTPPWLFSFHRYYVAEYCSIISQLYHLDCYNIATLEYHIYIIIISLCPHLDCCPLSSSAPHKRQCIPGHFYQQAGINFLTRGTGWLFASPPSYQQEPKWKRPRSQPKAFLGETGLVGCQAFFFSVLIFLTGWLSRNIELSSS